MVQWDSWGLFLYNVLWLDGTYLTWHNGIIFLSRSQYHQFYCPYTLFTSDLPVKCNVLDYSIIFDCFNGLCKINLKDDLPMEREFHWPFSIAVEYTQLLTGRKRRHTEKDWVLLAWLRRLWRLTRLPAIITILPIMKNNTEKTFSFQISNIKSRNGRAI